MTINPLQALADAGQSVWLDDLRPDLLRSGELKRLIVEDAVSGLTANPTIFAKAIGESDAYDARIRDLAGQGLRPSAIYERLAVEELRTAADIFRPTYDRRGGRDGFVSLEVSPALADDTEGTIAEARRLWREVDRPNLMIKVPGTGAGVPAIRQLIADGVNVNVTLLFALDAYLAVADAHMAGLEARHAAGGDIASVHGVASFFVSRIDTRMDRLIDDQLRAEDGPDANRLADLRGRIAIANARVAYQRHLELLRSPRWQDLAEQGATPQRLLWASTGTKNPDYSDVLYVENLIGPGTVNTLPPKTLAAFRDHGHVRPTLTRDPDGALAALAEARAVGLDLERVTAELLQDGVRQFGRSFDELLAAVAAKAAMAHA